jgi:multiple sugar transport system substrate-binding protein
MDTLSKKCFFFLAVIAILSLLAGCGGQNATQAAPNSEPGTQATPGSNAEKIVLTLWVFEGENEYMPIIEEEYEASHPNIDLQITEFPEDEYTTKLDTALAAGSPPDLGFVYDLKYLKLKQFLSVDDLILEKEIDLDTFNQGALTMCRYEGRLYCLGSYSGALMLFFNKDVFDAAGLAYPSSSQPMTLEEYAELAGKLTIPNTDLSKYIWGGFSAPPYWWIDQRTIFSEDGRTVENVLNSPSSVRMFETLTEMIKDGFAPSQSSIDGVGIPGGINVAGNELLAQKRVAMSICDTTVFTRLEEEGIHWGVAPLPVPAGTEAWVPSWTDAWGVFTASQHPQEALDFIAFIATEGNVIRSTRLDTLPLDSAVAEKTNWAKDDEGRKQILEVIKLARPGLYFSGMWDVMNSGLDDTFLDIAEGQLNAQASLDQAVPTLQKALDEAWETWDQIK